MKKNVSLLIVLAAISISAAVLGGFWWKQRAEDAREAARRAEAIASVLRAQQIERDAQLVIDTQAIELAKETLKESHGYTDERIESLITGASAASTQRVLLEMEISARESITRQYGAGLSPAQQRMQADEILAQRRERRDKQTAAEAAAKP